MEQPGHSWALMDPQTVKTSENTAGNRNILDNRVEGIEFHCKALTHCELVGKLTALSTSSQDTPVSPDSISPHVLFHRGRAPKAFAPSIIFWEDLHEFLYLLRERGGKLLECKMSPTCGGQKLKPAQKHHTGKTDIK